MLHAIIMAGGGGTRFWPRSRLQRPKQFLALTGDRTLLQLARDRLEAMIPPQRTWVITGEAYRDETSKQLPALGADQIVGEPVGRDTAPCVGLGAALVELKQFTEAIPVLRKAVELDGRNGPAQVNLGAALLATNQFAAAIPVLRKVVELDPKSSSAHVNLGWALNVQGELDEAIAELRQAFALGGQSKLAHVQLGSHQLARVGAAQREEEVGLGVEPRADAVEHRRHPSRHTAAPPRHPRT